MSTTGTSAPTDRAHPSGPQQRIAALRANVLAGRGPGATPAELAAHQHQRTSYGGVPVTAAREQLALATAHARRAHLNPAQARAAARLSHPTPPRPAHRRAGVLAALALGAALGFLTARAARRRHR